MPTPTPTPPPPPTPSPTPTAERTDAGEIIDVTTQEGYVDDDEADPGDRIYNRGFVRTDEEGSLQFRLNEKIRQCNIRRDTRVDIQPSDRVLLRFARGTAACLTTPDDRRIRLEAGANAELRMSDPMFLVTVVDGVTTVRVQTGLVEVGSRDGGEDVFLGPNLLAVVVPGGGPGAPGHWELEDLDPDEQSALGELGDPPKLDFSMPEPDGSEILQRLTADGDQAVLAVWLDEGLGPASQSFADRVYREQTSDWGINSEPQVASLGEAREALITGGADVVVSPEPIEDLGRIPFFDDAEGTRAWILFNPGDPVFGEAQQSYLRNLVIEGRYGRVYEETFQVEETPYEAVAALFGLD